MNVQHGSQARVLACVLAAVAVAVTWAGAVAPAWSAARGMTRGVRPPGAGDASVIGVARLAGSWGRAIEVPGLGALNKRDAVVLSVSCASAGSCASGGVYTDRRGHQQGFVVSERHGVWGTAIEVPGLGALNKGGNAGVSAGVGSVSCGSAGSCAAGGSYADASGHSQGFVAAERNGRWGTAIEVPGLGTLNKRGAASVSSVSCASAGSCAAGGSYADASGHSQGFVAAERNGRWGTAIEVPGLGALNKGGHAAVTEVSCGSAGSCAAGGDYQDRRGNQQGFVAAERNGRWATAIEVPGLGTLNAGGYADVYSVSCPSAGNCAAGGDYTDGSGSGQGFVAVERNGVWGKAIEVPGLEALNAGFNAEVDSVSCASAGNCAAGGAFGWPYPLGFVVSEKNGVWGRAIDVPGLAALTYRPIAYVTSVSCASPGNCAAGGTYADKHYNDHGFVAVERNGRWGTAIEVPGLGALNKGGFADVNSVSCAPAGTCAAGGDYSDRRGHYQGFVVSQTG